MSEPVVCEIPPQLQRGRRSGDSETLIAIANLPSGKALRFELKEGCRSLNNMRNSLIVSGKRLGIKLHTSIQDGAVFVWRSDGGV